MARSTLIALLSAILFCPAQAAITPVPLEKRASKAEQIILARVSQQQYYQVAGRENIYTLYTLEIAAYLKGGGGPAQAAIIANGGRMSGRLQITHPNFYLASGQEVVVFLSREDKTIEHTDFRKAFPEVRQCRPYAGIQGVLQKRNHRFYDIGSQRFYTKTQLLDTLATLARQSPVQPGGIPYALPTEEWVPEERAGAGISSLSDGTGSVPADGYIAGTTQADNELIINGSGFGSSPGTVWFSNADDGGATLISSPYDSDLISWTDTKIRVKIPDGAGTGTVRVDDSDGNVVGSSSITVHYAAIAAYSDFLNFPELTRVHPKLSDQNGSGGYTFQYNNSLPNTTDDFAGNADAVTAFENALISWRCETAVRFEVDDTGTSTAPGDDGIDIIAFVDDLASGTLGVTTSYFSALGINGSCDLEDTRWVLSSMDIRFKSDDDLLTDTGRNWNFDGDATTSSEFDFETVALHELGHAHGLGHVIDGTNTQVMHYAISAGTDLRTLSDSEIDGGNYQMTEGTATPPCLASNPPPMTAIGGGCAALPVELLYFEAKDRGATVELQWATAVELNNDFFTVEHSTDGKDFQRIAVLPGAGSTQQKQDYTYTDQSPAPGLNYYRLWQTDYDGQRSMEGVRTARLPLEEAQLEVQQPVRGNELRLTYRSQDAGEAQLRLFDLQGRQLFRWKRQVAGYRTTMVLALPDIPAGAYVLQCQQGRNVQHKRIIRQ